MTILFPVPGYIAKMVRDVQVQRMQMVPLYPAFLFLILTVLFFLKLKTDSRVQDVTEGTLHAIVIFHSDVDD